MRLILFLLLALVCGLSHAQPDTTNVPNSTNGWYLAPHGTIRILLLFAEIDYDVNPTKDPASPTAAHWPKGQLPKWKDEVFDPQPAAAYLSKVTRYYHDVSLGRYTVLGDYIDTILTLRESEYATVGNAHGIGTLAVKEANKMGALRTHHGLSITDFDLWKRGGKPGMPKQFGADDPHSYDHVMVIVRNSGLTHGQGSVDPGSPGKLFGFESDSQSRFGGMNALPFEILKHEFNHLLLGGNNFHSGGGNAAQFESHTLCVQGGWSLMGGANSSLLTCSGWDRDRLGWSVEGAPYRINAHNATGGFVNGDIDPMNGDTGTFVLRDFVTSGDALRIRMPFLPEGEKKQWLWLENHGTTANNGSWTDRFHWEDTNNPCVTPAEPGIYAQMQIERDDKYGGNIYGGSADYLHPLTACGHFDVEVTHDTLLNTCPFGGRSTSFRRIRENPLAGNCEQELIIFDRNNDGALERGEHYVPSVLKGEVATSPRFFGRPDHAFRINGSRVLNMASDPSSANMLTTTATHKREKHAGASPDNRTVYLNGIRVELLAAQADGALVVRVSTGDTRVDQDVIWSADSIVLPPLHGRDGRSLTLTQGHQLLIDRSRTPTRLVKQGEANGRNYFAPPTRFTIMPGATVLLEAKSELRLETGSTLHLMQGSELIADRKARIIVDGNSLIVLHGNATLRAKARLLKKLRRSGRLVSTAD